ncbi:MAG: sensor histidine kinase [Bacteroidetes bacterium]|nr:sensor histidine kinase [Bacteroidota bacterium]
MKIRMVQKSNWLIGLVLSMLGLGITHCIADTPDTYFQSQRQKTEYFINNNLDSAHKYLVNMTKYARKSTSNYLKALGNHYWVVYYYYLENLDSLQLYADSAEIYYCQLDDKVAYLDFLKLKANVFIALNKNHSAIEVYKTILRDSPATNFKSRIQNLEAIANLFRELNLYDSSYYYAQQAISLAKTHNEPKLLSSAYSTLATMQFKQALYHESLANYLSAKKADRKPDDRFKYQLSINIAKVYNAIGQYKSAVNELASNEVEINSYGDQSFVAAMFEEYGESYKGFNNLDQSNKYFEKAANIHFEIHDTVKYLMVSCVLLKNQLVQEKYLLVDSTLQYMFSSYGNYLQKDVPARAQLVGLKADLQLRRYKRGLLSKGKLVEAANELTNVVNDLEAIKRNRELPEFYLLLIEMQRVLGNPTAALASYDALTELRDTLFNEESTRKLAQLELQYDFDKKSLADSLANAQIQAEKDAQIATEQVRVKQRTTVSYAAAGSSVLLLLLAVSIFQSRRKTQKQKIAIEKRNTQIEWLLKEIHHRVKNNMQIVSSLMSIQGRSLKDEDSKAVIRESQNRIKSMSLVHESLYQAEDLSQIEVEPFISNIATAVQQSLQAKDKDIELNIDADKLYLNAEQAVPVGIIINELASNAFKHAFANKNTGELRVAFKRDGDNLRLEVSDDGSALSKDFEFDFSGKSIGMALVQSLVEDQLGGSFVIGAESAKFMVVFKAS